MNMKFDAKRDLRGVMDLDPDSLIKALWDLNDWELEAVESWTKTKAHVLRGRWWLWKQLEEDWCKSTLLGLEDCFLHEFACDVAEDVLIRHERDGGLVLRESKELLRVKRRWILGDASDDNLSTASRAASRAAYWAADWAADWAAYWAADWAADWAAYWAADWAAYWAADWAADWAASRAAERNSQKVRFVEKMIKWIEQ